MKGEYTGGRKEKGGNMKKRRENIVCIWSFTEVKVVSRYDGSSNVESH